MTELTSAIEPLLDYLTNCGCLRPMKTVNDKQMLIEDILMFQVINRVRGPFERLLFLLLILHRSSEWSVAHYRKH